MMDHLHFFAFCNHQFGRTPLQYAASFKHVDIIEVLLEGGADVNAIDLVSTFSFCFICFVVYSINCNIFTAHLSLLLLFTILFISSPVELHCTMPSQFVTMWTQSSCCWIVVSTERSKLRYSVIDLSIYVKG